MVYPVRLMEEAEEGLVEAATWLADEASVELANRFIDLIESTVQKLAENRRITRSFIRIIGSASSAHSRTL